MIKEDPKRDEFTPNEVAFFNEPVEVQGLDADNQRFIADMTPANKLSIEDKKINQLNMSEIDSRRDMFEGLSSSLSTIDET